MAERKAKIPDVSALEQDLLTLLKNNQKLYGLEFVNAIAALGEGVRTLGFGSLYPTLQRLQRKKLVTSEWGDQVQGPRRRYYSLTKLGRQTLETLQVYRCTLESWRSDVGLDSVNDELILTGKTVPVLSESDVSIEKDS